MLVYNHPWLARLLKQTALPHPEYQYLNTLHNVRDNGVISDNRTGVTTRRILGVMHKYDFQKYGFPLFTTKKTWFKGIAQELLWFLTGSSNIQQLVNNGVGIWTDDAYRVYKTSIDAKNQWIDNQNNQKEYAIPHIPLMEKEEWLEKVKAGKQEGEPEYGEIGPVYGVQWRRWTWFDGRDWHEEDQIASLIDGLINNPTSRRHIISAWNVPEIPHMGLPPCHVMSQYTIEKGALWCHMYQRSCDMFLGVPFNVASYSLLTYMLAHVTGLKPGGLIHTMHDCHIYENHLDAVAEQLEREPLAFPRLELNPDVSNIDDFTYDDIRIVNYKSHEAIKAELNVG